MPCFKRAFIQGLLLALSATSAFAAPQPLTQTPEAAAAPAHMDPLANARRITAAEAREALAKGEAVLVDVRSKEAYDAEHAQGAILIPVNQIADRAAELPKDKLVITYCT
jgi:hypothetical protein